MMISEKAHGKFILLGEHFVVHSQVPAIALPLKSLWCNVDITDSNDSEYFAEYENIIKTNENPDQIYSLMARAFETVLKQFNSLHLLNKYKISSKANFPISRGFGSSAAFAVALTKAVAKLTNISLENESGYKKLILNTAYEVEKIFHGKPSGVDTCVIIENVPIVFERKDQNTFSYHSITNKCVDFLLIDSGPRENSSILISRISNIKNNNPSKWSSYVSKMKSNSLNCAEYLPIKTIHAAENVFDTINSTNDILSELGLSSPEINNNIRIAYESGAKACKPSGAGTGGATLLATHAGDGSFLKKVLQSKNISILAHSFANDNNSGVQ